MTLAATAALIALTVAPPADAAGNQARPRTRRGDGPARCG